jgi:hypothetical protein
LSSKVFLSKNYAKIIRVARNLKINMTTTTHTVTCHSTGKIAPPGETLVESPRGKDNWETWT